MHVAQAISRPLQRFAAEVKQSTVQDLSGANVYQ